MSSDYPACPCSHPVGCTFCSWCGFRWPDFECVCCDWIGPNAVAAGVIRLGETAVLEGLRLRGFVQLETPLGPGWYKGCSRHRGPA